MTRKERQAQKERREAIQESSRKIVISGKCPYCGSPLRRNMALSGWYQCGQYGADGWRMDNSKPSCSFQCFID